MVTSAVADHLHINAVDIRHNAPTSHNQLPDWIEMKGC